MSILLRVTSTIWHSLLALLHNDSHLNLSIICNTFDYRIQPYPLNIVNSLTLDGYPTSQICLILNSKRLVRIDFKLLKTTII